MPVVDFDYIKDTISRELGPIEERFLWFNPEPIAAASLGQVHRAQLHNGDRVVVKVQRPNITDIVQTDLAALRRCGALHHALQAGQPTAPTCPALAGRIQPRAVGRA